MAEARFTINADDRTRAAFKSVRRGLNTLGRHVLSVKTAVLGLAGAGGFGVLVNSSLKLADANAKLSDRLGIATQDIAAFQHLGELSGSTNEAVSKSLERMTKNIGDAAQGFGQAKTLMEAMNLNVEELGRLNPAEQYRLIAERISELDSASKQVSATQAIFGRSGAEVLNMIQGGAAAFDQARMEVERYGIALDRVDSAKIEAANDALSRSSKVFEGIGTQLAVQLAPYIEGLATAFSDLAIEHDGFREEIVDGAEAIANSVAFIGDVYRGLEVVWGGLEVSFKFFVAEMLRGLADTDAAVSGLIDKIPGLDAAPNETLQTWAQAARAEFVAAADELDQLVMTPMPSAEVEQFFARVREESQRAAEQVAADRKRIGAPLNAGAGDGAGGGAEDAADKQRQALQGFEFGLMQEVVALEESFRSKAEVERAAFESRQLMVEEARAREIIGEQRKNTLLEQLEAEHQQKLAAIQQAAQARRLADVSDMFGSFAQLAQQGGEKYFSLWKNMARAQAAVDTYAGAQAAFKDTPGPIWFRVAAAGAATAAGLARVAAINQTSLGSQSAGSAPSGGAGVGSGNVPPVVPSTDRQAADQGPVQQINIYPQGDLIDLSNLARSLRPYNIELGRDTL